MPAIDPLAFVLAPHAGDKRIDEQIRESQARVRASVNSEAAVEQLGWMFVTKARESFDPGFYKFAEQCALVLESRQPGNSAALLLRGHCLQSQHRFQEAETLARELVKKRGLAFDYGLLGDILVDVGRVDDAVSAYQAMLDLKPDPQGYARAAHVRWLKGDLSGALELMHKAARGASPSDPESAAWMHVQLARYLWQTQANDEAMRALEIALDFQTNYAPALFLRGRMLLSAAKREDAIKSLRTAAKANPLPEYQWVLSEALRSSGREKEAGTVESELNRLGACSDPRTYSLYLAIRHESGDTALALAREELANRADIFTHDAMAWALASAGKIEEAQSHMSSALAEGTSDARLFFHATVIAAKANKLDEANAWRAKATALKFMLLPSELEQLQTAALALAQPTLSRRSTSGAPPTQTLSAVANESTGAEN